MVSEFPRHFALYMLLFISFALAASQPAHAGQDSCIVTLRQLEVNSVEPSTFVCSKSPCSGSAVLSVEGKTQNISIEGECVPGNLYLKFRTAPGNRDLSVGNWAYLHIALGESGAGNRQIVLYVTPEKAIEDSSSALLHRPIIREPTHALATVELQVALIPKQN
jgi:hypothetical protein